MIKTVEQYLESLDDGRKVWCLGEKVTDVRTYPSISTIIRMAAMDYVLPNHPDYRIFLSPRIKTEKNVNLIILNQIICSPQNPWSFLMMCLFPGKGFSCVANGSIPRVWCMHLPVIIGFSAPAR
ncbi:MAG: hypothetical protein A2277_06680 [Desulfobacterales bacterium RIFOXYA12_FULL_46_15]|nr:MAG: hypothetical protein A2277_06680 [Desulfobacterales bacterium RIFOXYA12_FULL_46_15]